MLRAIVFMVSACLALTACKTAEESLKESGKKPLTTAQIKQLFDGKTLDGVSSRGNNYKIKYEANGKSTIKSSKYNENGKWWVEGKSLYCTQWATIRNGAKNCRRLYKVGKEYQSVLLDGSVSSTFTVQ